MISGFNQFNSAIKQLRAEGVGLAIDDFGSGYAGLSLLTRFQPDKLKIDRDRQRYPPERAQAGDCEVDNQLLHRSGDYAGRRRH